MGWDYVATLWDDSDDKYKVSSTSKDRVEDTINNVDADERHTNKNLDNVDDGHTDGHVDVCNWSVLVSRDMIRGRNVHICTS